MYATNAMQTDFHEHYAATLAISISLEKKIHIETETNSGDYRVALVGPNTFHRTVAPGVEMIALIIDPETYEYGSIADRTKNGFVKEFEISPFVPLKSKLWDLYYGNLSNEQAWELQQELLRSIFPFEVLPKKIDERILRIAHKVRTELPNTIRMKEIGKEFSISDDRLVRLFKESMGIPLRRYLLWVKLLKASYLLKNGISLTEVAHAAGFSDSAHFTRTFKENFGFVPSLFFGHLRSTEVRFCETE
ncbi:AraC family transcriptional regulator [Leptospira mtsangambouensis]|uniref:AraC family transcriptional regulator n=2 Tax=Leptospira mtsangambouensis TaxID=2484912 RepID=A0ABY2NZV6_9LEPT|nr:AraC family transcriptional regulator [Leptospira mtsangambouensis]